MLKYSNLNRSTNREVQVLVAPGRKNGFEAQILREMHARLIKTFMDIIVMAELRVEPLSGYDVISYINSKFNLLVSSGTVYSLLYSLERNGLLEGIWKERKRTYMLTCKGEEAISTILDAQERIETLVANILKPSTHANM